MATERKKIIILARPNGAGKITFARSFLPAEADLPRFINADVIAAGIAPVAPETAAVRSGRLMLEEIALSARRGESFAFETTLSGVSYLRLIAPWRADGYRVSLFFLSLPNVETAIERGPSGPARRTRHFRSGHSPPLRKRPRQLCSLLQAGGGRLGALRQCRRPAGTLEMGSEPMTNRHLSKASNPDLRASFTALRRAAKMARETGIQTGTGIVIVRDGKPVRISAAELREKKS